MGYHVLTPLCSDDRVDVVVNRGWVPYDAAKTKEWERPSGNVEVVGVLSKGEEVIIPEIEERECVCVCNIIIFLSTLLTLLSCHHLTYILLYSCFTILEIVLHVRRFNIWDFVKGQSARCDPKNGADTPAAATQCLPHPHNRRHKSRCSCRGFSIGKARNQSPQFPCPSGDSPHVCSYLVHTRCSSSFNDSVSIP